MSEKLPPVSPVVLPDPTKDPALPELPEPPEQPEQPDPVEWPNAA